MIKSWTGEESVLSIGRVKTVLARVTSIENYLLHFGSFKVLASPVALVISATPQKKTEEFRVLRRKVLRIGLRLSMSWNQYKI